MADFPAETSTTLLTLCALLAIRNSDIDNDAARGLSSSASLPVPGFAVLMKNRALFVPGLTSAAGSDLANAAAAADAEHDGLPRHLPRSNPGLYAAGTVIISQAVMIPSPSGPRADRTLWLLALDYAGAAGMPVRAALRHPRMRR